MNFKSLIENKQHLISGIFIFFYSILLSIFLIEWNKIALLTNDSPSYIEFAKNIIQGKPFLNITRTPIYPIFLCLFNLKPHFIIFFQVLIAALSAELLYYLIYQLTKKTQLSLGIVFLSISDYQIIKYQNIILPETLSIFLLLLYITLCTLLIKKNLFIIYFFTTLTGVLLMMVKPIFIFLPFILYSVVLLRYRKMLNIKIFPIVVYVIIFFIWVVLSHFYISTVSISKILDINLIGKIIYYDLIEKKDIKNPVIYDMYSTIKSNNKLTPYELRDILLSKGYNDKEIFSAGYQVIFENKLSFLTKSFIIIPSILIDRRDKNITYNNSLLWNTYHFIDYIDGFILLIISALFFFRKTRNIIKEKLDLNILLFFILSSWYTLITVSFTGYNEFARLRIPIIMILHSLSFLFIYFFLLKIYKSLAKI
ncbi:MAG: hypothetical protein KatS3mg092_0419 [Patescibacteria group bacterium]|nr:MAG: hypothetical protein KatS3mg092_0419 [Patescibacteria group bacterium]